MPFNITTGTQYFSSGSSVASIQNWQFVPPNVSVISSIPSSSFTPPDQSIDVQIRDILASSFTATHDSFTLSIGVLQDSGAPNLVMLSSTSHTITAPIDLNASTSLNLDLVASFENVSILLEGTYRAYVEFRINGVNTVTSIVEELDFRALEISLERVGSTVNVISPRTINLVYLKGAGNGPVNIENFDILPASFVGLLRWRLSHESDLDISIPGIGSSTVSGGTTIEGSGVETGTVTLNSSWENKPIGLSNAVFEVFFNNWLATLGVSVNVAVFDAQGAIVEPSSMQFFTAAPFNPSAQFIDIFATGAYTITAPSWLQLSSFSGTASGRITVEPIDVSNFSEGEYFDNIVIDVNGTTIIIPVYYQVNDDLDTNLDLVNPNFTLDQKTVSIAGYDNNHYLKITTEGTTYDISGESFQFNDTVKVPFFKTRATYILGKVIHQAQRSLSSVDAQLGLLFEIPVSQFNYSPLTTANINLQVIDRRDNIVRYERLLSGTKWVPGTSPINLKDRRGVLSYKTRVSRITTKGMYFFNVFNFVSGGMTVKVNGITESSYSFSGGDRPFKRVLIVGANYREGDRVSIHVNYYDENGVQQSIDEYVIIYPAQEYSRLIAFVTPFNTIELLECTGQLTSGSAYSRRSNTVLRNGVSVLKHVDTNRDDNLFINTGFIPEDQRSTIDLLNRNSQAWLLDPEDGPIEIMITSNELAHSDTENFLYDFNLEFNINRDIDAQIHLF